MSGISDLIEVNFQDKTSYGEGSSADVVAIPFMHWWGPVNSRMVLSSSELFGLYPKSLPISCGASKVPTANIEPFANVSRLFAAGAASIETVRVAPAGAFYAGILLNLRSVTTWDKVLKHSAEEGISVRLKYKGLPCQNMVPARTDRIAIAYSFDATEKTISVKVLAGTGAITYSEGWVNATLLEEWEGSIEKLVTDGISDFIEDVVNSKSAFIDIKVNEIPETAVSVENLISELYDDTELGVTNSILTGGFADTALLESAYSTYFSDFMVSQASIVIPSAMNETIYAAVRALALSRKDCYAITGYAGETFSKESIIAKGHTASMFNTDVAGREEYLFLERRFVLDGTALMAGSWVSVAQQVNTNQIASAFSYGRVSATIDQTLSFAEVLELHKNQWASLFTSVKGPLLWGIKTTYGKPTSYFGYANVMRTITRILKPAFATCTEVVHTVVGADPVARVMFETSMQSILDEFISEGSIKEESYADASAALNSAAKTNGNRILQVVLVLYPKSLTESIKINIVATDDSVTATLEQ